MEQIEVCFCLGITLEEIIEAIKDGACDIETLMEKTGAGTSCKQCISTEEDPNYEREIHLQDILKELKQKGICK